MPFQSFGVIFQAIAALIFMGGVGYYLVKRRVVSSEGMAGLSDLVIDVCLPLLMFVEIARKFRPQAHPDWWLYPLLSVAITLGGYLLGRAVLGLDRKLVPWRREFLGLTTFQNSGYLPVPLVASLLSGPAQEEMFINLFLFLLGFNMTIFSFGVTLLCPQGECRKIEWKRIINPPTVGILLGLGAAALGLSRFVPEAVWNPLELLGRCTVPLSMIVVGGNLALLKPRGFEARPLVWGLAVKMLVLPLAVLGLLAWLRPPSMIGWLLLVQAAVPPAALLSVISQTLDAEDRVTSQGIFYGHLAAIVTLPLLLALFTVLFGHPAPSAPPLVSGSYGW